MKSSDIEPNTQRHTHEDTRVVISSCNEKTLRADTLENVTAVFSVIRRFTELLLLKTQQGGVWAKIG